MIFTTRLYGRMASMTAFAVAASSVPKAIAVGPDEERRERVARRAVLRPRSA